MTFKGYVSSGKNDPKSECLFMLATPLFANSLEENVHTKWNYLIPILSSLVKY